MICTPHWIWGYIQKFLD